MSRFRFPRISLMAGIGLLVIGIPVLAQELRGTVKSVDRDNSRMVVHDELGQRDVVVNFNKTTALKANDPGLGDISNLKPGTRVSIAD